MIKFILSIVVIVISVAFAFFYVRPQYGRIQNSLADLKILNETLKSTESMKELVKQIGDSLDSIDPADTERARIFLPETIGGVRFASNLQSIAARNGMILMDVNVISGSSKIVNLDANKVVGVNIQKTVGATAEKKYNTTKVNFSLATTYEKFHLLLNDIERSLGIINITSLYFEEYNELLNTKDAENIQKGSLLYQYRIEIETYSLK